MVADIALTMASSAISAVFLFGPPRLAVLFAPVPLVSDAGRAAAGGAGSALRLQGWRQAHQCLLVLALPGHPGPYSVVSLRAHPRGDAP